MSGGPAIVVLGAGGFIGRAVLARLQKSGVPLRAVLRAPTSLSPGIETLVAGTLGPDSDWAGLLDGARAVVHLASRAHAPPEGGAWIEQEVATARALAAAARKAGVEQVLFMSSIKTLGAVSGAKPFDAETPPAPADIYGRGKRAIEAALAPAPGLVILRPPLVYGPGVKGNFCALLRLVARRLPLPFAAIDNRRSLVFVENLADLVATALAHREAPGQTFLVRDDEEVSTPALIRRLAKHLGSRALLFPCPVPLLRAALGLAGRGSDAEALCDSLSVDDSATRAILAWRPRVSLDDGLAATCRWFEAAHR